MPLQNRVDPWGRLHAVPARGTLLGNRGILHNDQREIVVQWRTKAWITCLLEWKGRRRTLMRPGSYTELFFLDEATAFAAGHRPCAECRRVRFSEFKSAWQVANARHLSSSTPRISAIDAVIHAERTQRGGGKITYEAEVGSLPDGTMVAIDGVAYLLWGERLLPWSFVGYRTAQTLPPLRQSVHVLTPASIVQVFRHGFQPQVHDSGQQMVVSKL